MARFDNQKQHWTTDFYFLRPGAAVADRVRVRSPVQTERGAKAYERALQKQMLDEIANPHLVPKKEVPTLAAYAKTFLETYPVAAKNSRNEARCKRVALQNHWVPLYGRKRLDEIGSDEIMQFAARKQDIDGLSAKTVVNYLGTMRKLLEVAKEAELIAKIPKFTRPTLPPLRDIEFDFLTFDETAQLLAAAEPEWFAPILVDVRTGLRVGELLALQWPVVDLTLRQVTVKYTLHVETRTLGRPKNNRKRIVPLSAEAHRVFETLKRSHSQGFVFSNDGGITPLNYWDCYRALQRCCARAKLRGIGWHVLRHTFASHLVMKGVVLPAIRDLMGHATIAMTERYANVTDEVGRAGVQSLDAPPAAAPAANGHHLVTENFALHN